MAQQKIEYIVTFLPSKEEFRTFAVSEADAINNIHYKRYFGEGIWTEMCEYSAEPSCVRRLRKLYDEGRNQKSNNNAGHPESVQHNGSREYVQMSFSW